VLDSGARGSTTTFVQRKIGDVLLTWENEALLALAQMGQGEVEVITPSVSIRTEPSVAWLDGVVDQRGTRAVAEAYLRGLYEPEGQEIIARNHYRPREAAAARRAGAEFPEIELFEISDFGGWPKVQQEHFVDGALFDRIYQQRRPA
jgi:sulfate transport system substrate-binding protein